MGIKNNRKIIITGGVAVGKSSIVNLVCEKLNNYGITYKVIPEYIDVKEDGLEKLNKYLKNEITAFYFQNYIIDFYESYLNELNVDEKDILIFERSVDDSITCFSNMDNAKGRITTQEFFQLYEKAKSVDEKYNLPSYLTGNDYLFVPIKTVDINIDGSLITDIIRNRKNDNIIIGLYNSDEQCYNRMINRNRPGEKESYSRESISKFNYHYKQLYKELMTGDVSLRFASLGKLIRM